MKTCGIYGIRNVVNGKWYVGQSVDMTQRKLAHFSYLRGGRHHNYHLQCAFIKYGVGSFEFHVLEEIPENMLDVRECAWMEYYKSEQPEFGYNSDSGGNKNKHFSEEHKRKIGKAIKGRVVSLETRRKLHEFNIGKHHSVETCRKMSESHTGMTPSKEICQKLSEANMGHSVSKETRKKISEAKKGKPGVRLGCHHSNKTKKILSEINKGKHLSVETRLKISKSLKNRKH